MKPILLFIFGIYTGDDIDHLARGSLVCFIISLLAGLIIRPVIKNKAKCGAIMVGSPIFLTLLVAFLIPFVDPYFYIRSDVGGIIWLALLLLTPGALIIGAFAGVLVESFIKRYPGYHIYLVITFLLIITLFAGRIALTPTPTPIPTPPIHVEGVYLNPPFQEAMAGEEVIVKVVVERLDSRVSEGEINLAFNPSVIQVVSIES